MKEITVTKNNFTEEVLNSDIPVIVDFWAEWCGPCRMLAPIIEEIAEEADGKYKVGKINVDNDQELAMQFNIMSIPTVAVFKNGQAVETAVGFRQKEEILAMIK